MKLITTNFGIKSTAEEVAGQIDLKGKRAIVTGGASGIGIPTTLTLAAHGAEVILAVRNEEAGQKVANEIISITGNKNVYALSLDLTNRKSIQEFTGKW